MWDQPTRPLQRRSLSSPHLPPHIHTQPYTPGEDGGWFRGTVELVGHSHHTGKVSLLCGSSCARPVLVSGWRPCCTRCTYTASPAATNTHTPNFKEGTRSVKCASRTIHKTARPQFDHIWTKPGEEFMSIVAYTRVMTHTCARTHTHKHTEEQIDTAQCGNNTQTFTHWYPPPPHTPSHPGMFCLWVYEDMKDCTAPAVGRKWPT